MTLRFSNRFPILALLSAALALLAGPALARCSQNLVQFGSGIQVASLDGLRFAADMSPNRAIVTFVGPDHVVADAAGDRIVAGAAADRIVAEATHDPVVACAAEQEVVTLTAIEPINA